MSSKELAVLAGGGALPKNKRRGYRQGFAARFLSPGGFGVLVVLLLALHFLSPLARAATVACTPTSGFNNCFRITYSGAAQTITIPSGVSSIDARLWGAAGGGANSTYYQQQGGGGGGGFARATVAVTGGQVLYLYVGQGGIPNSTAATFGYGGAGGNSSEVNKRGGSGGGASAILNSASLAPANLVIVAGGGGGASPGADAGTAGAGGGGGATGGQDALPDRSGRGGTGSVGGAAATNGAGCLSAPTAGTQGVGGNGANANGGINEGGGGGGGGYFGGGGGTCQFDASHQNGGGGGGSSYTSGPGASSGSTTAGQNFLFSGSDCAGVAAAGNNTDALYTSGTGEGSCFGTGGNGEIVIQYRTAQITVSKTALGTGGTFTFNGTNGIGSDTIVVGSAGATVTGATKVSTAAVATTLTETIPSGWTLTGVSCSGLGSGGSYTPNLATGQVSFNAAAMAANASIACTFTNLYPLPSLTLDKTASTSGPVNAGHAITYTYRITNTGNVAVNNISIAELFNGYGTDPVPLNEVLVSDAAPAGDSSNGTTNDGVWQSLGPGDVMTFTAPYTVVQADIDNLQ